MLIFHHSFIENQQFYKVTSIDEIKNTPPNSIILSDFDKTIITYAKDQQLTFAIQVTTIVELVLAAASQASFLLVSKGFSTIAQQIADDYMYDAKILLIGNSEEDIEFCALNGIDGIIFL
ncbi:hypothetical protein [Sulfurospirillum sp. 1612]|uniref:hypothetical protein n=1 Tax=Sulfurospirillum sp. 1612 TaxID=3094835 RepID=UPI002F9342A3